MSTISIISDKYGNRKKVSNARDGINLTSVQNRKNISARPNNINSALGIADNRSKILSVPYPIIKEEKKPMADKVEKKENKIEEKKPMADNVEKKENKIEEKKPTSNE